MQANSADTVTSRTLGSLSNSFAENENSAILSSNEIHVAKFGILVIELIGLTCLVYRFGVESAAFLELFTLATVGFAIHYFVPLRFRMVFFLALSLVGIAMVLGVVQAAWLVAIGIVLIALAHLRIAFMVRVLLIVVAVAVLSALRAGWAPVPWSNAIWPILGSMFMFRLIVYLYDLRFGQSPTKWTERLAYFFMLPNVCFPLFPVVDSRAFLRTYYDAERHEIYQRGAEWIFRGLVQLILYRLIYLKLAIDPYDVANIADLVHYFLWLFLLYLRVSGQFHVIVGMLHLFGFHLPETHHLFYFASSFTDFWRRINIYWKDFMMKVFYYPILFRVRWLGSTTALIVSTMVVFALTWALHALQLFWIRGTYVFTWNDILFWVILCGLVVVNAVIELRFGRRRTLKQTEETWRDKFLVAIKTFGTFTVICILWSFWSSESLSFWFSLWPAALVPPTAHQLRVALCIVVAFLLGLSVFLVWHKQVVPRINSSVLKRGAVILAELFALNLLSISAIHNHLGPLGGLIETARFGGLNAGEMTQLERGYYEDLLTVDRFNGELAALYMKRPQDWSRSLEEVGLSLPTTGFQYELRPNCRAFFKGAQLQTNRWGMHDQDYDREKPIDCFRIALLGASHVMGTGVDRDRTCDAFLEKRLNEDKPGSSFKKFEVLNFAVYGYYPIEQIQVIETKAASFEPDAIFYVGHPGDPARVVHWLIRTIQGGHEMPNVFFDDICERAGVDVDTPLRILRQRLQPFGEEILSWIYDRIVAACIQCKSRAVFVLLPMVPESAAQVTGSKEIELARRAGFTVLDLSDVYEGEDRHSLWIAEWDAHPNAIGHERIGNRFFELIQQNALLDK